MDYNQLASKFGGSTGGYDDLAAKFGGGVEPQQPQQPKELDFSKLASQFGGAVAQERPQDQSVLRQVADVPLQIGQGAVAGVRMLADVFGANNPVSKALKSTEGYIGELFSAQSKQDAQEVHRIMEEAKDKGVLDQVKAGLKAITVAPVDIVANALGTSAGVIAASLLGGESVLAARAIGAGVGIGMGAGTVKGTIYDAVKGELEKTNMPPDQIEKRAELAQAYNGKNLDMILTGAALGGLGAVTGFEPSLARGIAGSILKREGSKEAAEAALKATASEELKKVAKRGAVKQATITGGEEFITEGLQGSQEKLSENIALRREGYDVPLMRGVIAQGVLEGIAGLGLGATTGAVQGRNARQQYADLGQQQLNDSQIKIIEAPLTEKEKPKGVDIDFERVKGVAIDLVSAGVSPENAREMAIEIVTEEIKADADAEIEAKGAENVAEPITSTSGAGVSVVGQPDTNAPAGGAGVSEPSGVVPTGQNAPSVDVGEKTQPTPIKEKQPIVDEKGAFIPSGEKGGNPIASAGFKTLDENNNLSDDLVGATMITGMDVTNRNKGAGTKLLSAITNWADTNGRTLALVPAATPDGALGGLSQEQLKDWYARNGFENHGDYMVRNPQTETKGEQVGTETPEAKQATQPTALTPEQIAKRDELFSKENIFMDEEPKEEQPAEQVTSELKGKSTDVVAENVEPIRLEPGTITDETPAVKAKPETRGRKKLTPEEKAAAGERDKGSVKLWKAINSQIQKAVEKFNDAITPLDPSNFPNLEQLSEATESRRIQKIQAIKSLLEQQKLARGKPKLTQAINDALAHESITPKELADIKDGMQRASKSSSEVKVGRADTRFNTFTTAEQALRHVIKTGNPFQKFLAKRLLPFIKGTTFTVLEEGEAVPDVIRNGGAEKDWELSRGLFLREVASGQKHIFVRGMSGGPTQGINNVTVLHEALHAALNKKLEMGLDALQTGFDRNSAIAKAMGSLIGTMELTRQRVNTLMDEGKLPFFMEDLIDSGIFEDPKEFLAYAMTDPQFQKFLMNTPGVVRETLFSRFVNSVRQFFGMAPDTVNGLSDVINITDKMLSSRMTSLMRMKVQDERATASDIEISSMAKKNVAKTDRTQQKLDKSYVGTIKQPGILEAIQELVTNRKSELMGDVLASNWDAWKSGALRQLLPSLQTETLVDWVKSIGAKDPQNLSGWSNGIQRAWNLTKDMNAMRVKGTAEAAPISDKLYKLHSDNIQQFNALGNVMHYSTLAKIDPSKDTRSKAMNELWSKLDDDSKELFEEVRDYFEKNYDQYHQLLMDQISASKIPGTANDPKTAKGKLIAEIKKMYEVGAGEVTAVDGTKYRPPYFPLMRYGQYWVRFGKGVNREFYMFESQADRNLFMRQRIREMQKAGDARTDKKIYEDGDMQAGDNIQEAREDIKDTSGLIKAIFESIEDAAGRPMMVTDDFGNQVQKYSTIDPEKMKDDVYQLYLNTLPERNFRRQFIHRKGTTGFSYDISRNFATASTNMANQLARIKYAPAMTDAVQASKDALKNNPEESRLSEFTTEMRFRVESEAYPDPGNNLGHRMSDIANKSAFLWLMSTVKTAVAQLSAIPVFAAPVLASRHGVANTAREMGRFMNIFNNFSVMKEDDNGNRSMVAPTVAESKNVKLNAEEKKAAQYMIDRGISETTLAYDLGNRRKTPTYVQQSTARKVGKAVTDTMTGLFHHSERMIREITFMASFRLNRDKYPGKSFEEVALLAEEETYKALGNFASVNRPRGLIATAERQVLLDAHKPLGRAVLQFKMFPAFVTTYFVRNFYRMVAKDMSKQERKEAATQFFGSLMTSYALAGMMGVPGMSFAIGIAQGLRNLFRDEDDDDPIEKRDLEFWIRNIWLQQTFGNVKIGDHNMADLMDRGLVAGLTGYDISSSLSLNNMWFPEMKEQATAQATMQDYLLSLGGPFASLVTSQIPKAVDYLNQGKILQGVEQLLPGMARTPITAYRYSQEGATTASGALIKEPEEFTLGQIIAQGMGFTTEGLVAQREAIFKANALLLQVKNEKKQILNRLDVDIRSDRDLDNIMDDVVKFNYKNWFDPITNDSLKDSIKNHLKQRVLTDRGFYMDKKYYPQVMDLLEPSTRRLDIEASK
jgi:hypothetical protein